MNPLVRHFSDLKFALQELESALQQPRDEDGSIEQILYQFPAVIARFADVLYDGLAQLGEDPCNVREAFERAAQRNWLKGDKALWLYLVDEYEHIGEIEPLSPRAIFLAGQIRSSGSLLWQTYELLTQRFRWQSGFYRPAAKMAMPRQNLTPVTAKAS